MLAQPNALTIEFGSFRLTPGNRSLVRNGDQVQLGSRALDILITLAECPGEVVSKKDLLARVWPNLTVDETSLRFNIAMLRKALGDGIDGARYILSVAGRGYCLVAPVSTSTAPQNAQSRSPVPGQATASPPYKLPPRPQFLFGRAQPLNEIAARLAAQRFVTITGPGGVGKTTTALALCHSLRQEFGGAICFADLSPLRDPSQTATWIAQALGAPLTAGQDPRQTLLRFTRHQKLLIVLDNCEHVIDEAAIIAEQLFLTNPGISLLATSRELLRAEGEYAYQLQPLAAPTQESGLTCAQLLQFPAAQLFLQRASITGYALNDNDAAAIGTICRKLDGIALAIELAAASVQSLGIAEVATHLHQHIELLTQGRRTAPARHQTLSATLDWSCNLLRPTERTVLNRLAIFTGVFTLEAAQAIAVTTDISPAQVIDAITGLVEKSLITANISGPITQYRLLTTTRAYALQKLRESGESEEISRHHTAFFRQFMHGVQAGPPAQSLPTRKAPAHKIPVLPLRTAI